MKLRWSLLFLMSLLPLAAQAEIFADESGISGNGYFGVNLSGLRYEDDFDDFHEVGAGLRLGYEFNNYLAVEGHLGAGLTNDTLAGYIDIGVDYLAGIYLRGNIFLWDPQARLYGLIGMTRGKITAEAFGISDTLKDTEMGYGIGVELFGDSRNAINLELMRYMDGEYQGDDYNIDAFNLGYPHRF